MVVSHAGEGGSRIAEYLAKYLAGPTRQAATPGAPGPTRPRRLLRASARTDVKTLDAFIAYDQPMRQDAPVNGIRIIDSAHLLGERVAPVIDTLLDDDRIAVAYFVDADALRARPAHSETLRLLNGAWLAGAIQRLDMPPLTPQEVRSLISRIAAPGVIDDLQLQTLVELAEGRPLIAADLAHWARQDPGSIPRRYPHGGSWVSFLGSQAPQRLSARTLGLSERSAHTATVMATLSPVPAITASLLFGESTITEFTRIGLVRRDPAHRNLVMVPPLLGSALAEAFAPPGATTWEQLDRRLHELWRSGYPIGEAATLRLSRHLMRSADTFGGPERSLLIDAASICNRLGTPLEAEVFLRAADTGAGDKGAADTCAAALQARLATHLIQGEYREAMALAQRAFTHVPERPVPIGLLFALATVVGWTTDKPGWWKELLEQRVAVDHPGAPAVLSTLAGLDRIDPAAAQQVAQDVDAPPALRFSAVTFLTQYNFTRGDTAGLRAAADHGSALVAEVLSVRDRPLDHVTQTTMWLFGIGRYVQFMLAGVAPDLTGEAEPLLLRGGVTNVEFAGQAVTTSTAWALGIARLMRGDLATSRANLRALVATVNPAQLAVCWGMGTAIRRYLRSGATQYPGVENQPVATGRSAPGRHDLYGNLLLGPGFSDDVEMPDWMRTVFVHARVLDGTCTVADAAKIIDPLQRIGHPGPLALREHIRALLTNDAEKLLDVGHRLVEINYWDAADHALTRARALFTSRRAAAQVAATNSELGALQAMRAGAPRKMAPSTQDEPVALTSREREICRLIDQGLTNAQIAQQLFLSVRTVESHVFRVRSKLGAARRSDIPLTILQLQEQGRLTS